MSYIKEIEESLEIYRERGCTYFASRLQRLIELEKGIDLIKTNSTNPAHTMTQLGLEESMDCINKMAENLQKARSEV